MQSSGRQPLVVAIDGEIPSTSKSPLAAEELYLARGAHVDQVPT